MCIRDRYNSKSGTAAVTVHSVTSNTLRDAQKRPKAPFRAATLGIFVQNTHENTSRDGDCLLYTSTFCSDDFDGFKRGSRIKTCYVCFTEYDETIPNKEVAFHKLSLIHI